MDILLIISKMGNSTSCYLYPFYLNMSYDNLIPLCGSLGLNLTIYSRINPLYNLLCATACWIIRIVHCVCFHLQLVFYPAWAKLVPTVSCGRGRQVRTSRLSVHPPSSKSFRLSPAISVSLSRWLHSSSCTVPQCWVCVPKR